MPQLVWKRLWPLFEVRRARFWAPRAASPSERKASQGISTARTTTTSPKTMKVFLLICARHGTRDTFGVARTRRSAVSADRPRARGGSGSCAARRRPRGRRSPASRRGRVSKEAFSGKRPSRPPTRWTWTSTGISGMPQVKIRTQAAVLRPTPGSEQVTPSTPRAAPSSVQSRSGSLAEPLEDRLDPRRLLLAQAAGPDRLLDLARPARRALPPRSGSARAGRRRRGRGCGRWCAGRARS